MNKTGVEYGEAAWNFCTGCLGPGGTPQHPKRCPWGCWAETAANGRLREGYLRANTRLLTGTNGMVWKGVPHLQMCNDPFWPRFWDHRLSEPKSVKKPTRILVCFMGDLFHPFISSEWIRLGLEVMRDCPQHTFLCLTKWPIRYQEFAPWPDNCWLGTTVTCQEDWDERWRALREVRAKTWVSFEPLLGQIHWPFLSEGAPNWAVIGAMTGRDSVKPERDWVLGLEALLDIAGVPTFMKGNLDCEALGIARRQEITHG